MIKKLAKYVRGYGKYAILTPVTVVAEVILEIFIPYLMSLIIDKGIQGEWATPAEQMGYVTKIGLLMLGMAVVSLAFGALSGRFAAKGAAGFASNLRMGLFGAVQDFSFENSDKFSTPSLITRLTTDVTNTQMAYMMSIRLLFRAPVMLISATVMAVSINAELAVIFAIAIPVLAVAILLMSRVAFPRFSAMLKKYDDMNAFVQENLIAMRVVKAFVRKDYEKGKFNSGSDMLRAAQVKAEKVLVMLMPLASFTIYGCIIAVVWFGGNQIIAGSMETGELMSFITYVSQILISLMMVAMVFTNLILSRASMKRIAEVLDEKPAITDDMADADAVVEDGSIDMENVFFSYTKDENNCVLEDINLHIRSGERVGILGGTGSSKTTLVHLIPRLYDTTKGVVKVGGRDVREYTVKALRDSVSMVLQKNTLFRGTIAENLRWGNAEATQEELEAACRAAQAHEFIMSFPDGYETMIDQGGVNVSGGQRQRLTIARALLKKPKVMILDDSMSAVDMATDAKLRAAISKLDADITVIIIAQRIASVQDADKIIVMDEGRITDIGTHDELMEKSEIYRDVFESQKKGVE